MRKNWDLFDFKTSILTSVIASELHIRKARNFADSISANLVLHFANQRVAEYFSKLPETYLFDRNTLKNKLILRNMLKDRIKLDSNVLGKMGYIYDSRTVMCQNWAWMFSEIQQCSLWHQPGMVNVVMRLKKNVYGTGWSSRFAGRLIYQIYLLSAWYNRNEFL